MKSLASFVTLSYSYYGVILLVLKTSNLLIHVHGFQNPILANTNNKNSNPYTSSRIHQYHTKQGYLFQRSSSYSHLLIQLRAGSSSDSMNDPSDKQNDEHDLDLIHTSNMMIQRQSERQRAIYAILTSTTLNLLGFTLTSPLNPALGSHFNLPLGASFGSLTSAYPAGMLLGQFVWARMSDFIGRKRILSISLLGGGIGLCLQSIAVWYKTSLHVFLATRVFTGIFSGVAPVAKAYLADLGEEVEREREWEQSEQHRSSTSEQGLVAKYLGWRDAASTLAYILGPAMGGILFELVKDSSNLVGTGFATHQDKRTLLGTIIPKGGAHYVPILTTSLNETGALAFVIGIAGLASIIASGCISVFVPEDFKPQKPWKQIRHPSKHSKSNTSKEESKIEEITANSHNDDDHISCPLGSQLWTGVATVCVISFLYHVSDSTFFAFYPALLQNQFGLDARAVGMSFTGFACISFLFSAMSLSSRMIEKVGVVNTCVTGLSSLGTGLTALSFLGVGLTPVSTSLLKVFTWLSAAVYFSGVPLYGPTVPLMLLMCVPSHQRGAIMGLDGAVNTIARIISPIIMGDVYRRGGSQLTFRLAGAAAFASAGIASLRRFYVHRSQKRMNHN